MGLRIEIMSATHQDTVLAMTSHIPQLIAYSIVATATELESHIKHEVIKYSAAGFRDFTRLAGSDPVMWRDVYSKNKDSVLEMLGRFSEDLSTLQKAIRNDDIELLERIILASTKKGATILDPISGSGTKGVASIKNGRKYIGIEISKKYLNISIKRVKISYGR